MWKITYINSSAPNQLECGDLINLDLLDGCRRRVGKTDGGGKTKESDKIFNGSKVICTSENRSLPFLFELFQALLKDEAEFKLM